MTTTPTHIRALFLRPAPTYSVAEAARLLGMDWRDVRGWMECGELEGIDTDDGLVLPWAELVSFGMDFWSQEVVEEALGADLAAVLPELLRLTELEVRIPRMEVVTLERLAARDGETVDAVLARELRDLVSVHADWLSREVPGFAEALAWPEVPLGAPAHGGGTAGPAGTQEGTPERPRRGRDATPTEEGERQTAAGRAQARVNAGPLADVRSDRGMGANSSGFA